MLNSTSLNNSPFTFKKVNYVIFIVFSLAYILTLQYRPYPFSYVIKILPILSLSLVSICCIPGRKGKYIFTALLFSAVGDIFLAMEGNRYFIPGLCAFGCAHIMYISAFLNNIILKRKRSFLVLFFIIYGLIIELLLIPHLGKMFIPGTIYLFLLAFSGISSVIGKYNYFAVIPGTMLFMISDSIIAVNSFLTQIPHSSFWIMLTYFPAQLLITYGSTITEAPAKNKIEKIPDYLKSKN
jgi:uncharacterized membrane protein YhhN